MLHVMHEEPLSQRTVRPAHVRDLLSLLEALQQLLEVKTETLYVYPRFLRATLARLKGRKHVDRVTAAGERIVRHVQELHALMVDLGGQPEQDFPSNVSSEARDAITAFTFQEALALRMLKECRTRFVKDWPVSTFRQWTIERIETILEETQEHSRILESAFARTEPRFHDAILERFRVTALP